MTHTGRPFLDSTEVSTPDESPSGSHPLLHCDWPSLPSTLHPASICLSPLAGIPPHFLLEGSVSTAHHGSCYVIVAEETHWPPLEVDMAPSLPFSMGFKIAIPSAFLLPLGLCNCLNTSTLYTCMQLSQDPQTLPDLKALLYLPSSPTARLAPDNLASLLPKPDSDLHGEFQDV